MNIKEFSNLTGLSSHTLRYYEKIGVIRHVQRNLVGHRLFSSQDIEYIKFIVRLKNTGMLLEQIIKYAELRELGDSTLLERKILLADHHKNLKYNIELQLKYLHELENKINFYNNKISS